MNDDAVDYLKLSKKIKKYVKTVVSEQRYEHSLRTADMCEKLCRLYELDKDIGYFCGISHDMCKNFSVEELKSLAVKDGNEITVLESEKPGLLHGRAAAVLLSEKFDVTDIRIIEAVQNHTFGKAEMSDYGLILYVSDKIEPGREHITDKYLEKLYKLPLKKMVLTVLDENIKYLAKKGRKIAPESEFFYQWLAKFD